MSDTNPSAANLLTGAMAGTVFAACTEAMLWIDAASGEIALANPAAGRLYGYAPTQLAGMRLRELAMEPEWSDDLLAERIERVPLRYQRHRSGRHIPVEMQLHYARQDDRDWCLVAVRDQSERIATENRQKNHERLYTGIFGAAPYPIFLLDSRNTITEANDGAVAVYGYTRDELAGLRIGELLADPADAAEYRIGREGRLPACGHRRKDGGEFLAEATLSLMRAERGMRTIVVIRDVTEEMQSNARLHASEERWRFALEGHGDGLLEWQPENDAFFLSRRFCEQLGYAEGELSQRFDTWEQLLHPDDQARSQRALLAHLTGGTELVDMTVRLRHRTGDYRWIEVRAKAIAGGADGQPQRLIGTARDVTEERERELKARQHEEIMFHTARLASMGEMATVLAHELNQPLAAIGNFTSAVTRRIKGKIEDEDAMTALGNIVLLVERAGGIVHRIRDFTRKGQTRPEMLDLNAAIAEIVHLLEPQSQLHEVRIETALATDIPPLRADRLQLGQLILNLAKNGMESMSGQAADRILTVRSLRHGDDEVELRVEDYGCGLPEQMALDVITPFFTTKPNGLGMGLVICRTIIENHGGRLWAAPNGHRGTVFHAVLPISR